MAISVGSTQHLNTSGELQNISSLDSTTQTTISNAVGGSFTHPDTSSQSSVNNSGSTVIQDITLDTNGHVTGITSTDVSSSVSSGAGTLVGYGAGAGLNGNGNATLKANTSYLFFAPNSTSSNIYIYQNNSLNDRIVNGIPNFAGFYIYANGSTQRNNVGMGGVSGGNPGPHLIFELT